MKIEKIKRITYEERTWEFNPPLHFVPKPYHKMLTFEHSELGIDIYANTYAGLRNQLAEEIAVLWDHYALVEDKKLTKDAQLLKQRILSEIRIVKKEV